jgi:hypothetical protein
MDDESSGEQTRHYIYIACWELVDNEKVTRRYS